MGEAMRDLVKGEPRGNHHPFKLQGQDLQRRDFNALAAAGVITCVPLLGVASTSARLGEGPWRAIEKAAAGRLGVAVLDTGSGRLEGHRLDERFVTAYLTETTAPFAQRQAAVASVARYVTRSA